MSEYEDSFDLIRSMAASDEALISMRETLIQVMREFGGPNGLAKTIKLDFDERGVGDKERLRVALAIISLLHKYGVDLDARYQPTMEDLEAQFSRMMEDVVRPILREGGVEDEKADYVMRRLRNAV